MSNRFELTHTKSLLKRAAAKENDSSEEKYITEFLNDIINDTSYDNEDRLNIVRAACEQMKEFCTLVVHAVDKDRYGE